MNRESVKSIRDMYFYIKQTVQNNKFGSKRLNHINIQGREVFMIKGTFLEFELFITTYDRDKADYKMEIKRWCYTYQPGWKFISMMEAFDYNLPEDVKMFIIYNLDLFSKKDFLVGDFLEALERAEHG